MRAGTRIDTALSMSCRIEFSMSIEQKDASDNKITEDDIKKLTVALSKAFGVAGYTKQAEAILTCSMGVSESVDWNSAKLPGSVSGVMVCSCGCEKSRFAVPMSCNVRVCPYCAKKEQRRRVARFARIAQFVFEKNKKYRYRYRLWTFGTSISLYDPQIVEKIIKLRRKVVNCFDEKLPDGWRERQGIAVVPEFGTSGARLHFHVIQYGSFVNITKMQNEWRKQSGISNALVDVESVPASVRNLDGVVGYISKYMSKGSLKSVENAIEQENVYDELAKRLVREFEVFRGRKTYITYGVFRSVEVEREPALCKVCEAPMMMIWSKNWELYVETGFATWAQVEVEDLLSLFMGNNSNTNNGNDPPPKQLSLPNMPEIIYV